MSKKNFIYFPSFSAGAMGNQLEKNLSLDNDLTIRFYSDEFPERYRHREMLITAGHHFKDDDYKNDLGLTDKNLVMGDSGGYQIASGAIKWRLEIRDRIFKWLENNQSGNTDFLNVIQGTSEYEYMNWYDEVKEFPFQGWAVGGGGRNLYTFMSGVMTILNGKEHLKDDSRWIHILGVSKIKDFLMLEQLQKSLNEVGSNMRVTTDSSSPDRAVVFGSFYSGYSIKRATFESINVPKYEESFKGLDTKYLPQITEFDREYLRDAVTWDHTFDWKGNCTMAIRLHNFMVFKQAIDRCVYYVNSHPYILEQAVSADMFKLLNSIDEMVKSDKPYEVFQKYKPLYLKLSNVNTNTETKQHSFF